MADYALIFIDTNIVLDFYRIIGSESGLSMLTHIDNNHDKIIVTSQVEMEYKKHRQRVIIAAHKEFKSPATGSLNPPAFLRQTQAAKSIAQNKKAIEGQTKKLKERIERCLKNPGRNDPVYKTFQRLFKATTPLNLSRDKDIRVSVRELAEKRFLLGYPPRKDSDTSIGDPINWEWIVHCAKEQARDVVIVSRDSDYGPIFDGHSIINDWLAQEFSQRVGGQKISLTSKLTEGFKLASIKVSPKEVRDEADLLKKMRETPYGTAASFATGSGGFTGPSFAQLINPAGEALAGFALGPFSRIRQESEMAPEDTE